MNHSTSSSSTSTTAQVNKFFIKLSLNDAQLLIEAEDDAAARRFHAVITPDDVQHSTSYMFDDLQFMQACLLKALKGQDPQIKIYLTEEGKLTYSEEKSCDEMTRVKKFTIDLAEERVDETTRLKMRLDRESAKVVALEARVKKLEERNDMLEAESEKFNQEIQEIRSLLDFEMFDSQIITKVKGMKLLREWTGANNPKFQLLYRGSRDGFTAQTFHQKCDQAAHTFVIVRSEHKKVFGGYSDQTWSGSGYKASNNTWIFSLDAREKHKIQNAKNQKAVHCKASYGPTFGAGHDLYIADNCSVNNSSYANYGCTYELKAGMTYQSTEAQNYLAGSPSFKVEEIEVFEVVF